ncbi:MAG TPA: hypothetical protein VGB52_01985 [Actinomycetota bacterium]
MGIRATSSARLRALLVGAVVLSAGAAIVPAHAAPPPPPVFTIDDGGDGWVNATEATALTISGTYDEAASPAVTQVIARIVNSPTCDNAAAEATPTQTFAVNLDGTFTSPPFDVSGFTDGAILCARARTINADGQSLAGFSTNTPTLDLTAPATPTIIFPAQNALVGAHFDVNGSAAPGSIVEVLDVTELPVTSLGSDDADVNGLWQFHVFMGSSDTRQLQARAFDEAGNVSAPTALRTIDVDADAPTVAIELPANNTIYLPGDPVLIEGTAADTGFGILAIEVHVFSFGSEVASKQIKTFTCEAGCPTNSEVSWSYVPPVGTGYFTAKIWAIDVAGNRTPQPAEVAFLKIG